MMSRRHEWTSRPARVQGVTLIELVVVIVVIGILAAIAVPSYRDYMMRSKRGEARAALLALGTAQEKFYLQCNTYASTIGDAATSCPGTVRFPATSERGYYAIAVTAADVNGWTATATAVAGQPQIDDTKCRVFQLTSTGLKTATNAGGASNDAECWDK
jgi:type IV pilus assembly protein PilE